MILQREWLHDLFTWVGVHGESATCTACSWLGVATVGGCVPVGRTHEAAGGCGGPAVEEASRHCVPQWVYLDVGGESSRSKHS